MHLQCNLIMLILVLTLDGQVHTEEIFGGHEAAPHSRPYMVLFERYMQGAMKYCCGFLLNEDFVMTAAHCQAKSYTVLLGVHDIYKKNEIQRISVEQAFPHKDYNETNNYKNDIMLLKLSSKANFSKTVGPIALAGQGVDSPKSCIVSGWGRADRNSKYMSPKLMEVNVTLVHNTKCDRENLYCSEGQNGPGEGDSGGPLVCEDGKAYGVVSTSIKPNSGGPQIYTFAKIPDHRSWIKSTMNNAFEKL